MTAHERITAILERARVAGGWIDDVVAAAVLKELGLDGTPMPVGSISVGPATYRWHGLGGHDWDATAADAAAIESGQKANPVCPACGTAVATEPPTSSNLGHG